MSSAMASASAILGVPVTTTDDRQARTTVDLLPFLPLALIITVFGVALLIAQVAPNRVTSGVYQVTVGEGPAQFRLATESLTCSRIGDSATCTAPVAGRPLTIDIEYRGFDLPVKGSTCTARHGDRPVPCTSMIAGYGHASNSVWIPDPLGVTEPELTRLRDALPWWRTGAEPSLAGMALLCMLAGTIAGGTAYLLSKRTRALEPAGRLLIAAGTGLLGQALLALGALIIAPNTSHPVFLVLIHPFTVTGWAALTVWQYQVCGAGGHDRVRRWMHAIGATIATTLYTVPAMFFLLLLSGFVD